MQKESFLCEKKKHKIRHSPIQTSAGYSFLLEQQQNLSK